MTITYKDFEKVDIRVGKVIEVEDFGPEIGIKSSGGGWVLITPAKQSVKLGDKLK